MSAPSVTYATTNTRNSHECKAIVTHRKCQDSVAAVLRSSSATTKELPFCTTYFFLTKANLPCTRAESLLHFSKLQEREEGSRFTHTFLTQSVTSPPAHNGGSPSSSSHLYLVYLSNYLFPRFYSDLVRQTQTVTREREEEFDARQRQRLSVSSLGEICARFSHNPHDVRHIRQTQRRTLRACLGMAGVALFALPSAASAATTVSI